MAAAAKKYAKEQKAQDVSEQPTRAADDQLQLALMRALAPKLEAEMKKSKLEHIDMEAEMRRLQLF